MKLFAPTVVTSFGQDFLDGDGDSIFGGSDESSALIARHGDVSTPLGREPSILVLHLD